MWETVGPLLIQASTVVYFQMHSMDLTYETLESLQPTKSPAPWLSGGFPGFHVLFSQASGSFGPTVMLSLFMLRARPLFSLGEMDSQKINEVTLAHEFSLALSNTAVVSLMDWVVRRTP